MLIGYERVSTRDQRMTLQIDALKEAGCTRIFPDHLSGSANSRPGLDRRLSLLARGTCLWSGGLAA